MRLCEICGCSLNGRQQKLCSRSCQAEFSGAHIAAKANRLISKSALTASAFFYTVLFGNKRTGENCAKVKSFTTSTEISGTIALKI
jgi:hypothetical protein